jgi:hypothetical protein
VSRFSRKCWSLDVSQSYGSSQLVTGISLPFTANYVQGAYMAILTKEARKEKERKLNICSVQQQSNVHVLHEFLTICSTVPLYSNTQILITFFTGLLSILENSHAPTEQ